MTLSIQCKINRGNFLLDVDTELPDREVTALFGASGSGKTSILRLIAGLDRESGVEVSLNGQTWQDQTHFVPAH